MLWVLIRSALAPCCAHSLKTPQQGINNVCFHGEISKISVFFGRKKNPLFWSCDIQCVNEGLDQSA